MRAEIILVQQTSTERPVRKGLPRAFDFVIAALGLLLAAPIVLVAAPLISLSSHGAILFRQTRMGRHGRTFQLYNLRTMRPSDQGPQVTSSKDERITRLGRFLRRTKLDELPTLWNVLRGDMALVGPRPEVPRYVKLDDPKWQAVLSVRPGITDPVTLRLRDEEALLARINGDHEAYYLKELQPMKLNGYVDYLKQRSWQSDLKLLFRTFVAIMIPGRSRTVAVNENIGQV